MKNILQIPWPWRFALVLLVTIVLSFVVARHLTIEQDVVASIERSRPDEAALFHQLQSRGLFQDRVFIKWLNTDPQLREETLKALEEAAYRPVSNIALPALEAADVYRLLPFFPSDKLKDLLSVERLDQILSEVRSGLSLPGGVGMVKMLASDPLLLSRELPKLMGSAGEGGDVLVAQRVGPLDFEKVRKLYAFMQAHDSQFLFLAGDFFALENRDCVQRDITLCTVLSLGLGLLFFRFFCRQWRVLLFLMLGTAFASGLGLLVTRWVDPMIYGLVLAFASTFVSFNTEALVHLAGLNLRSSPRALVGMASAIGTTLLGFFILLASSLDMARQMAILSLASLVGFLIFLAIFADEMQKISFRSVSLPLLKMKRTPSLMLCAGLVAVIASLPKPAYRTDLSSFRYSSSFLDAAVERFSAAFNRLDLQNVQALPLIGDPVGTYAGWQAAGLLEEDRFHPLQLYRTLDEQASLQSSLRPSVAKAIEYLELGLVSIGVKLTFKRDFIDQKEGLDAQSYLKLWNRIGPLPWTLEAGNQTYLLVFGRQVPLNAQALPLHPKLFYEWLLADLSRNIGQLFMWGILAMLLYLIPWQRDLHRLALIFTPLLASILVMQLFFWASGRTINIVHIMGASLVIAVALDYSSILVSNEHEASEQGKVVLTGGLTLTSFGSLLVASHPVLRELGLTVFIGSGVAWLFALFCRQSSEAIHK